METLQRATSVLALISCKYDNGNGNHHEYFAVDPDSIAMDYRDLPKRNAHNRRHNKPQEFIFELRDLSRAAIRQAIPGLPKDCSIEVILDSESERLKFPQFYANLLDQLKLSDQIPPEVIVLIETLDGDPFIIGNGIATDMGDMTNEALSSTLLSSGCMTIFRLDHITL